VIGSILDGAGYRVVLQQWDLANRNLMEGMQTRRHRPQQSGAVPSSQEPARGDRAHDVALARYLCRIFADAAIVTGDGENDRVHEVDFFSGVNRQSLRQDGQVTAGPEVRRAGPPPSSFGTL